MQLFLKKHYRHRTGTTRVITITGIYHGFSRITYRICFCWLKWNRADQQVRLILTYTLVGANYTSAHTFSTLPLGFKSSEIITAGSLGMYSYEHANN